MPGDLTIFLSSTQVDLVEVRKKIIRFLGVLKSDILSMEVFGSDETKPVDFCLSQVRKCNLFIGVYAERYGLIDPQSGKSLTELEYLEAVKMLQIGGLKALLLYVIDSKAQWPLDLIERDPVKMAKLAEFKAILLSSHTVSFFQNIDDLPFLILRDVVRKIGIGSERLFKAKERKTVKQKTSLERPIGMEYYEEDLGMLFFGRDDELDALEDQILKHKMSLLIGSSGVGKTSLLYAGLMNRVKKMGWQTALVRPLMEPVKNLRLFLWDQLLRGDLPSEFDISSVVNAASTAHNEKQILVIIDQFEDILGARDPSDIEVVTTSLLNIFNTADENLRILICYRGDVEPQIGKIWQRISGSPQGLPRTYLGSLEKKNGKLVLESTLKALGITIKQSRKKELSLIDVVLADLESESFLSGYSGIYPPFMQMIIARFFEDKDRSGRYHTKGYYLAGQSKRIIADYLMTQLKYLGKKIEDGKKILIALVSSFGTKAQKTIEEISTESILPKAEVEKILTLLIDLRLVRTVNDTYEIAHDFLARVISSELVSIEEREVKKFKDLLASRTVAYESTKAGLIRSEHLFIYKFRNTILCTEDEAKLLVASHLSGNGPIGYWAKRYSKLKLINWTRQLLSERGDEIKDAACRFLIKMGEKLPLSLLAETFADYKEQHELSRYILEFATSKDKELLIELNRKKAEAVAEASETALVRLIKPNDKAILEKMARSNNRNTLLTFEKVASNLARLFSLDEIRIGTRSKEPWRRLSSIYGIAYKGNNDDLMDIQNQLKKNAPQKIRAALIKSAARLAIRLGNGDILRKHLSAGDKLVVEKTLEAIDMPSKTLGINDIFDFYEAYPFEASSTIYCISTSADIPELKKILSKIALDTYAREVVYALCKFGTEDEFTFLLRLFLNYDEEIKFWNPFAVVDRISDMATKTHLPMLKKIINADEFWRYYREEDRPKRRIPLRDFRNLYFIKRLAGTAFGKAATRKEFPVIHKMLEHEYWIIRNAALEAIRKHGNINDMETLLKTARGGPSEARGLIEAICIIDEKINKIPGMR